MTASRRGLAILTAIALLLGVILAVDRDPAAVSRSRRLFPDFDPETVSRLTFTRPDGTITVEKSATGWAVTAPSPGAADPAAIDEVLGALELASAERWVSRTDAARAGAALDTPRVTVAADGTTIAIGAASGADLVWALVEDRAALVESWVARALDRDLASLRGRAVVPVAQPTGIELHIDGLDRVLSGTPLRVHAANGVFRLEPERAAALLDAIASLRFTTFPPPTPAADASPSLRVLGGDTPVEVTVAGACDEAHVRLATSRGDGCAPRADWDAVLAAARAADTCDPRPLLPAKVATLAFPDGTTLEAHGGDWQASTDLAVDDQAVSRLLDALAAPAERAPAGGGDVVLTVTYADGTVDALHLRGTTVRRNDEPCAFTVPPATAQLLARGIASLVDRTLLDEDPYLLRTITVDGTTVTMGATFEAWTSPRGTPRPDAIAALRDAASSLTADELVDSAPPNRQRTLTLGYDAAPVPNAQPTQHALTIARPERDGRCRATVDDAHAILDAPTCAILLAPLL
jgi:hypothetical protein